MEPIQFFSLVSQSGMIFNKQLFGKISFVKIIVRTEKYLVEYAFFGKIIISDIFFR